MDITINHYFYNTSLPKDAADYQTMCKDLEVNGYVKILVTRFLSGKEKLFKADATIRSTDYDYMPHVLLSSGLDCQQQPKGGAMLLEWAEVTQFKTYNLKRGYYITDPKGAKLVLKK